MSPHERRNHLYALRRSRGLRQKHVAALLGFRGTSTISRYESGEVLPDLPTALMLEMLLGARMGDVYVNLRQALETTALKRAARLPGRLGQHIRGRLLGKD